MSIAALFTHNEFDLIARSLTLDDALIVSAVQIDSATVGVVTIDSETQGPRERTPVDTSYCWTDYLTIPPVPPAQAPWPGGTQSGPVVGVSGVPLGQNPSNALEFGYQWSSGAAAPFDRFSEMIPAGTGSYAYTPTLRDSLGATIPYDPLVWVADGLLQLVVFSQSPPAYYGFTPPLSIDYWRYVEGTAEVTAANLLPDSPTTGNVLSSAVDNSILLRSLVAGSGVSLTQDATSITITAGGGGGGLSGLSNEGGGAGVFDTVSGSTAVLRSVLGTANGLVVTQGATTITIDNTLTGANLGSGSGNLFSSKIGAQLRFNSLAGGSGVSVSPAVGGTITIANTGVVSLSNEGGAAEVYDSGTSGALRTLQGSSNGLTVTQGATSITIDNTLTGGNLGSGLGNTFNSKSGAQLLFNSIGAGSGILVSPAVGGTITVSNAGVLALANEGMGAQVYDSLTTSTLRTLLGTSNGLTVATTGSAITIDNTLTGGNVGSGTGVVFSSKTGAQLLFNSLAGGSGISVSAPSAGVITISSTSPVSLSNEDTGAQVYDSGTVSTLRTLFGTANGLSVVQNATNITIDNTLTGENIGSGPGTIFSAKSANSLLFNSISAGTGVSVSSPVGGVITISGTGLITLANEGLGAQVYDSASSGTLRTLLGTTNGLAITQNATSITVDNTLAGANIGTGVGLYSAKSGASLQFNSLVGAGSISISAPSGGNVTISSTAVTTLANEGIGAQVWDSSTIATLRTLVGTTNGVSVSQGPTTITVDNTLVGANLGAGVGVYSGKSGASLQFNSLVGSGAISISPPSGGSVTISSAAITALSNEGAGAQVWDSTTSATLRSLVGTTNGVSVTQNASTITFDNTLAGANLGTGTGVYSGKSGANLQFNSFAAGTGMSLAATSNVLTYTNSAPDQTVTLTAGTGITITGTYPNFTITAAGASMPALVNTQVFTASGNWLAAAPLAAGATSCSIVMCGGGGGGGSGVVSSTSLNPNGGGGGGPGGITIVESIPIGTFASSEPFVAGAGGAGGSGSGSNGSDGSSSTFNSFAAPGGSGGSETNTLTGTLVRADYLAGEVLSGALIEAYQVNTRSGSAIAPPTTSVADTSFPTPGFGGSGGNIYNGGTVASGVGSSVQCASLTGAAATTAGSSGAGVAATTAANTYYGAGGGGGGASSSGNGGVGGAGYRGSGGGGGGAAATGHTSGSGGVGGTGWLIVYSYA